MNQKFVLIFVIVVFVLGGLFYLYNPEPVEYSLEGEGPDQIACTADAKLCPDGSYVGRMPPDCDFAPCPAQKTFPPDAIFEDGTILE